MKYEIQISMTGSEWYSVRDEYNNPVYVFTTQDEAYQLWEKIQNQYPQYRLKLIEL
jgi:hypothetical protein